MSKPKYRYLIAYQTGIVGGQNQIGHYRTEAHHIGEVMDKMEADKSMPERTWIVTFVYREPIEPEPAQ